ncbi:MAG: outer membrane protein assembly factor BamD [Lentisphaerae bacterium]|nr:outer membrane protein assembly factor BamD [Lentisphaerota bacterium]
MRYFIATVCAWAIAACAYGQTAPNEAEKILGFADSLYKRQDYYRAITEYERFVFLFPRHSATPKTQLQIGIAYLKGQKPELAARRFQDLSERFQGQAVADQASLLLAETFYSMEQYARAIEVLNQYLRANTNANVDAARTLQGLCYLREGRPHDVPIALQPIKQNSTMKTSAEAIEHALSVYDQIPRKSPWVAGGLSALLPGAGQLYNHRPRDAALAFLLTGLFGWATYEAYERNEVVTGTGLAVLTFAWYSGNVYNACNGANKYNREQQRLFFDNLQVRCGYPLFSGSESWGVGVGFRF